MPVAAHPGPQIKQHTSRESCWFVRDGRVYDPTKFLDAHPGGPSAILSNAGEGSEVCGRPVCPIT